MEIPDGPRDGMGGNIHRKCLRKFYQDLTLRTKNPDLEIVSDGREHPSEASLKV